MDLDLYIPATGTNIATDYSLIEIKRHTPREVMLSSPIFDTSALLSEIAIADVPKPKLGHAMCVTTKHCVGLFAWGSDEPAECHQTPYMATFHGSGQCALKAR